MRCTVLILLYSGRKAQLCSAGSCAVLSVFQWCSKCEGEWCACLVSWVHLQEGPLVIVEGLHHFSEADTRVVVRVPSREE